MNKFNLEKPFPGNSHAWWSVCKFISYDSPGAIILSGPKGTGKSIAADHIAAHLLYCTLNNLENHIDFYKIHSDVIKVEDIYNLLDWGSSISIGKRKVYLIPDCQYITKQAQDKLLKFLEESHISNTLIFICSQDYLLPTIKSRCQIIEFNRLEDAELYPYLLSKKIKTENLGLVAFLSENCPFRIDHITKQIGLILEIYTAILNIKQRHQLLAVFHLLIEKDKENIYEKFVDKYILNNLLLYIFYQIFYDKAQFDSYVEVQNIKSIGCLYNLTEAYHVIEKIMEHKRMSLTVYTKNDFFDLIRFTISVKSTH